MDSIGNIIHFDIDIKKNIPDILYNFNNYLENLEINVNNVSDKFNENLTIIKSYIHDDNNKAFINISVSIIMILLSYLAYLVYEYNNLFNDLENEYNKQCKNEINIPKGNQTNPKQFISKKTIEEQHNHKVIKIKANHIMKNGLYIDSIYEVNNFTNINNIKNNVIYTILLRVQMKNTIKIENTKFELHGNYINNDTTRDMFMILNFQYLDIKNKPNISKIITNTMNYFNLNSIDKYKTTDFIVIAIGENNNNGKYIVSEKEFNNALINIGYEMENYYDIRIIPEDNANIEISFKLLLPIHEIYDIFMDIYNNTIFESKHYVMDNNNYESWKGKSINDLEF